MFVVVVETIVAPASLRTTWTLGPVIVEPAWGWATATVAGDDGRGPRAEASGDGAAEEDAEQPAMAESRTARMAAARARRGSGRVSWVMAGPRSSHEPGPVDRRHPRRRRRPAGCRPPRRSPRRSDRARGGAD